jgi:hypothetical protein
MGESVLRSQLDDPRMSVTLGSLEAMKRDRA